MAEKQIEKAHRKWARIKGWKVRKVTSPNENGAFDRIYIKMGIHVWIEWKQPGGVLSKVQEIEWQDLLDHGANAAWFDNLQDGKDYLNSLDPDMIKNRIIDNVTLSS